MKEESETEKTTRVGSLMVAAVYSVMLGACVAVGAISWWKNRGKGKG